MPGAPQDVAKDQVAGCLEDVLEDDHKELNHSIRDRLEGNASGNWCLVRPGDSRASIAQSADRMFPCALVNRVLAAKVGPAPLSAQQTAGRARSVNCMRWLGRPAQRLDAITS